MIAPIGHYLDQKATKFNCDYNYVGHLNETDFGCAFAEREFLRPHVNLMSFASRKPRCNSF